MSSKDALPTEVKHAIENFDAKLNELEEVLTPFLNEEKSLLPRLNSLDTAKLNLTVSYSIASLFACTRYTPPLALDGPRRRSELCVSIPAELTRSLPCLPTCLLFTDTVYLKTQGVSHSDHPVKKELVRK